jgi:hypothetical protein
MIWGNSHGCWVKLGRFSLAAMDRFTADSSLRETVVIPVIVVRGGEE